MEPQDGVARGSTSHAALPAIRANRAAPDRSRRDRARNRLGKHPWRKASAIGAWDFTCLWFHHIDHDFRRGVGSQLIEKDPCLRRRIRDRGNLIRIKRQTDILQGLILVIVEIEMVDAELWRQQGCINRCMFDAGSSDNERDVHDFPHRKCGLECRDVTKTAFFGIVVSLTNTQWNISQLESETTQSKTPRQTDRTVLPPSYTGTNAQHVLVVLAGCTRRVVIRRTSGRRR
jgi:hypothetical protein